MHLGKIQLSGSRLNLEDDFPLERELGLVLKSAFDTNQIAIGSGGVISYGFDMHFNGRLSEAG